MMMGGNFTMHVGFQNPMFYNKKVKGVKVNGACRQWDDPHYHLTNDGNGERDGC
jgi:hypothetical protein